MTAATYSLPIGNGSQRSPGWWAMVWTIVTEAFLFAFLLFAYCYLRSTTLGPWPSTGPLSLKLALPNTLLLLLSSGAYVWGEHGIRSGRIGQLRAGLLATFVLGAVFAAIQALEWRQLPFTAQTDAFGSVFYTITGFHGAHVIVGLLMNLVVQAWAWRRREPFTAARHLAVTNAGLYWHFVDIVWLVVFTTLYLSPRFT